MHNRDQRSIHYSRWTTPRRSPQPLPLCILIMLNRRCKEISSMEDAVCWWRCAVCRRKKRAWRRTNGEMPLKREEVSRSKQSTCVSMGHHREVWGTAATGSLRVQVYLGSTLQSDGGKQKVTELQSRVGGRTGRRCQASYVTDPERVKGKDLSDSVTASYALHVRYVRKLETIWESLRMTKMARLYRCIKRHKGHQS